MRAKQLVTVLSREARAATQFIDMSDLRRLPEIKFQTSVDVWFRFLIGYAFPCIVTMLWGEELWTAFLYVGVVRLVLVQHLSDVVLQHTPVGKMLRDRSTSNPRNPRYSDTIEGRRSVSGGQTTRNTRR